MPLDASTNCAIGFAKIDGRDADGLTLSALQRALTGKPGDTKTLVIERTGQQLTVKAVVARILSRARWQCAHQCAQQCA